MENLSKAKEFVADYILWITLVVLCSAWALSWRAWRRKKPRLTVRDVTMTVEGRKLWTDTVFLERLMDALLECVLRDEITEQEANAKLAIVAHAFHREELMPLIKAKKSKFLKAQLKANKRRRALNGKTKPLPIPTETSTPAHKPKDDGDILASILA